MHHVELPKVMGLELDLLRFHISIEIFISLRRNMVFTNHFTNIAYAYDYPICKAVSIDVKSDVAGNFSVKVDNRLCAFVFAIYMPERVILWDERLICNMGIYSHFANIRNQHSTLT